MKTTKLIFALAGFVFTAALTAPAQAADPRGTCPSGWSLVGIDKAKNTEEARKVDTDGNYDKYVCEKLQTGKLTYKDNDRATGGDKDDKDKDKDRDKDKG